MVFQTPPDQSGLKASSLDITDDPIVSERGLQSCMTIIPFSLRYSKQFNTSFSDCSNVCNPSINATSILFSLKISL